MDSQLNKTNTTKKSLFIKPWMQWTLIFSPLLSPDDIPAEMPQIENFLNGYMMGLSGLKNDLEEVPFKYTWGTSKENPALCMLNVFINRRLSSSKRLQVPDKSFTITKQDNVYVIEQHHPDRSTKNTVKLVPPAT